MTRIQWDAIEGTWAVWLDGHKIGYRCTQTRAIDFLICYGARFGCDRAALVAKVQATCEQLAQAATVAATVPHDATETAAPVVAKQGRCPHYRAIRRAFAIATELGLNTKADEAMRAAFGRCLGREVPSRESLNGGEWMRLGDLMKRQQLAW